MRTVVLFFVLIQSVLFCREQRPYLRALIVHDTSTPDIQIASTADVNRVKQAFSFIADQTGLSFKPTVVEASKLSKKTLCAWLKTIRHSSKKEVAFFYYAGRGTNIHTSKWPLIRLGKGLHISEPVVAKRIKSRKPKLGFVIFDCYGQPVSSKSNINLSFVQDVAMSRLPNMPGLRGLFRKTRGIFMGCSSRNVGQGFYSAKAPISGGLFTINFLNGLFANSEDPCIGWGNINCYVSSFSADSHISRPCFTFENCHSENGIGLR